MQVLLRIVQQAGRAFAKAEVNLFAVAIDFPEQFEHLTSGTFIADPELRVGAAFGLLAPGEGHLVDFTPTWIIIGPDRRVLQRLPFARSDTAFERLMAYVALHRQRYAAAPVLEQARILEGKLCENIISAFSPISRGLSSAPDVEVAALAGTEQREWVLRRLEARLVPELTRAFNFSARAIEYLTFVKRLPQQAGDAADIRLSDQAGRQNGGFAVWIALDKGGAFGGQISFPEYCGMPFDPGIGCAIVHSVRVLRRVAKIDTGARHFIECVIQP